MNLVTKPKAWVAAEFVAMKFLSMMLFGAFLFFGIPFLFVSLIAIFANFGIPGAMFGMCAAFASTVYILKLFV
jgi:hypothetical protein